MARFVHQGRGINVLMTESCAEMLVTENLIVQSDNDAYHVREDDQVFLPDTYTDPVTYILALIQAWPDVDALLCDKPI